MMEIIKGKTVYVSGDDIDTDVIIPARFLKCVTFDFIERYLFYDLRFDKDGTPTSHVFNQIKGNDTNIMIVGKNFGCGSSREHAPQSIHRFGIRLIIGESFAEIFHDNCLSIGLPVVTIKHEDIMCLLSSLKSQQFNVCINVNLKTLRVHIHDDTYPIMQEERARKAFADGSWDMVNELLSNLSDISRIHSEIFYQLDSHQDT